MGVDIFRRVPERRLARRRAAEQNGEFGIEADEAFEYARRALHHLPGRSEEHTSELQSLMRISYAVFCLKKKTKQIRTYKTDTGNTKKTTIASEHARYK